MMHAASLIEHGQAADPRLHFFEPSTQPLTAQLQMRVLSRNQHPTEWKRMEMVDREWDDVAKTKPSNLFLLLAEYLAASSVVTGLSVLYGMLKRARRHHLWINNRCEDCGYSLVGNISGVCPECGAMARERPIFG